MEAKVLDWLSKTAFFQKNESRVELIAQFPVGEYLRQLDPYYKQPAYRCDFLLRYHGEEKTVNVIIEYDGFLEHFHSRNKVHAGNWDRFYKAEDIERQLTLESYGYNFIRLNRFNLGNDPVAVLSERLYALVKMASNDEDAQMVTDIRTKVGELENGTSKPCKKCGDVLAKEAFWDPKLKNGAGSYGQICMSCKSSSRPVSSNIRRRYFGRKYR